MFNPFSLSVYLHLALFIGLLRFNVPNLCCFSLDEEVSENEASLESEEENSSETQESTENESETVSGSESESEVENYFSNCEPS